MVLYKVIGSVGIIMSALMMYFEMQKYEKIKLKQINSYILLIEYIKNQIECFLLPIDYIINNCSTDIIRNCGIKGDYSKAKNLEELLMSVEFYCDLECIEIIKQFSRDFGQGYIDEQIKYCDYYRGELINKRDKLKEKSIKEKKLRLALCLCASFSIILLLI